MDVKLWAKRLGAAALILAGVIVFLMHAAKLLDWPHLYPDVSKIHLKNLIFFALTLLALALAWISAAYLLLNAKQKLLYLLIPAVAFAVLVGASGLCLTYAVGEVPCTYTTSLAVCKEEFRSEPFRVERLSLYPRKPEGELTAYAHYEKGDVVAESVTRTYDVDSFAKESKRVKKLGLESFLPKQKLAARETVCYVLKQDADLWQILVVPRTKTVVYTRFHAAEELPSFAPQPEVDPNSSDS